MEVRDIMIHGPATAPILFSCFWRFEHERVVQVTFTRHAIYLNVSFGNDNYRRIGLWA